MHNMINMHDLRNMHNMSNKHNMTNSNNMTNMHIRSTYAIHHKMQKMPKLCPEKCRKMQSIPRSMEATTSSTSATSVTSFVSAGAFWTTQRYSRSESLAVPSSTLRSRSRYGCLLYIFAYYALYPYRAYCTYYAYWLLYAVFQVFAKGPFGVSIFKCTGEYHGDWEES